MTAPGWYPEFLFKTFITGRLSPGWIVLFNLHDDEDKDYFEMLEDYYQRGKIQVNAW